MKRLEIYQENGKWYLQEDNSNSFFTPFGTLFIIVLFSLLYFCPDKVQQFFDDNEVVTEQVESINTSFVEEVTDSLNN